ncbi:Hypothetical protein CINCED_3A012482 [Cinara cedri]|uniref:Uncharacterized protein n=1 Tax=Cinara cedri TaxID=506608 RepID=A0A5E4LYA2_9HEMI|nr:Hypothetical protein CINCED_3A012482 [Cinara cedri]
MSAAVRRCTALLLLLFLCDGDSVGAGGGAAAQRSPGGVGIRHGRSRNARNLRPNVQVPVKQPAAATTAPTDTGVLDNDIVNRLLRTVESQQQLGNNCTAGTHLNLGEGVVDRYAQVSAVARCLGSGNDLANAGGVAACFHGNNRLGRALS